MPKTNRHHILYCRNTWSKGYAKRLRDFSWLIVEVPMKSLHRKIHDKLVCVPMPKGSRIKEAYVVLSELNEKGVLKNDASLITRIDVLLCIWDGYTDCRSTCKALRVQRRIAEDYYNEHPC